MAEPVPLTEIAAAIRDIPDFPEKGIVFKDITPLLADARLFDAAVEHLAARTAPLRADTVVAIEARGFILGAPLALRLGCGFVPVRKPGKLPFRTLREGYALEYGSGELEAHEDAFVQGHRVLVVDDVLATGGTAAATARLVERLGGSVEGYAFLLEIAALEGRGRIAGRPTEVLISS